MAKPCVFIHTNHKQILGAKVARWALKRQAADPEAFDVAFIDTDYLVFAEHEGQAYLRDGVERVAERGFADPLRPFALCCPSSWATGDGPW